MPTTAHACDRGVPEPLPFQEPVGLFRRHQGATEGALSNRIALPRRDLPTRLADGLGLESTPVRPNEPAPLSRLSYQASSLGPPFPHASGAGLGYTRPIVTIFTTRLSPQCGD